MTKRQRCKNSKKRLVPKRFRKEAANRAATTASALKTEGSIPPSKVSVSLRPTTTTTSPSVVKSELIVSSDECAAHCDGPVTASTHESSHGAHADQFAVETNDAENRIKTPKKNIKSLKNNHLPRHADIKIHPIIRDAIRKFHRQMMQLNKDLNFPHDFQRLNDRFEVDENNMIFEGRKVSIKRGRDVQNGHEIVVKQLIYSDNECEDADNSSKAAVAKDPRQRLNVLQSKLARQMKLKEMKDGQLKEMQKQLNARHDHFVETWETFKFNAIQEARVMSLVSNERHPHPNIIRYFGHEVDEKKQTVNIMMEFIPNSFCLADALYNAKPKWVCMKDFGKLEAFSVLVMRQLVSAVGFLHENCIAHRDIKAENVIGSVVNNKLVMKLCDFGFSSLFIPQKQSKFLHGGRGTLWYLAPESVLILNHPGYSVDVWALGVLAQLLVTGIFPFDQARHCADSEMNLKIEIVAGKHLIYEAMSEEFKHFCTRALHKSGETRANIHELASHPWLNGVHTDCKSCDRKKKTHTTELNGDAKGSRTDTEDERNQKEEQEKHPTRHHRISLKVYPPINFHLRDELAPTVPACPQATKDSNSVTPKKCDATSSTSIDAMEQAIEAAASHPQETVEIDERLLACACDGHWGWHSSYNVKGINIDYARNELQRHFQNPKINRTPIATVYRHLKSLVSAAQELLDNDAEGIRRDSIDTLISEGADRGTIRDASSSSSNYTETLDGEISVEEKRIYEVKMEQARKLEAKFAMAMKKAKRRARRGVVLRILTKVERHFYFQSFMTAEDQALWKRSLMQTPERGLRFVHHRVYTADEPANESADEPAKPYWNLSEELTPMYRQTRREFFYEAFYRAVTRFPTVPRTLTKTVMYEMMDIQKDRVQKILKQRALPDIQQTPPISQRSQVN